MIIDLTVKRHALDLRTLIWDLINKFKGKIVNYKPKNAYLNVDLE